MKSILTKMHVLQTTKLSTLKADKTQFLTWGQIGRGRENSFHLELIIHFQLKVKGSLFWLTCINTYTSLAHTQHQVLKSLLKLSLSLPCHPLSSHITFPPFPILAPAVMGNRGRVREKVQLHLEVSFASLKVPSSSLLDNLWFHPRRFSGPPLPLEVGTEIHLREMEKDSTGSFILLLFCWVVLFPVSIRIIKGLSSPNQSAFLRNIICSNKTEVNSPNPVSFESVAHHSCSNSSVVICLHSAEFQ